MKRPVLTAFVALLACTQGLTAQMAPGTRSVGMGGGGMVFATGVDAVEWNPANLAWGGGWNISLIELGLVGIGSGTTVTDFLSIMEGDSDAARLIAALPTDGITLSLVAEGYTAAYGLDLLDELPNGANTAPLAVGDPLPSVGIAFGPVAVRVRSRMRQNFTLSKELADLLGNGFEYANIQNYATGNTGWSSLSTSEITASYGLTLGSSLSLGIGGRYVMGHGMTQGQFFEPQVNLGCLEGDPTCNALVIQTGSVEARDGTGYALDLGASLELPLGFRVAASGTNVVQRMQWDEDQIIGYSARFTEDDFDNDLGLDLGIGDYLDRFDGDVIDPNSVSLAVFEAAQDFFEGSYFPQVFRAGIGWQGGGTTIEATGIKVAPRGRYRSAWDERVSVGLEQRLPILTLRGGYGFAENGITQMTGGAGLRLGPVHLDTSVGKFSGERPDAAPWDGYFGTLGLQIRVGGQ